MDDHDDLLTALDRAADVAQLQLLQRQLAERDNALETEQSVAALRAKLDQALLELGLRTK